MGSSSSKPDKTEALGLCKLRRKLIKQAIESRYALAASHVSYTDSLRSIGASLRRFAEAGVLIEACADKSPSHSSYPSPSPSHIADSPLQTGSPAPRLSYMKSGATAAVTVSYENPAAAYVSVVDDESMAFPMPPPPPPPIPGSGSWDYFDPVDDAESFRFMGLGEVGVAFDDDAETWGKDPEKERCAKTGSDRNANDEPELGHASRMPSNRIGDVSATENGVNDQSIDCSARDLDGNKAGPDKELGNEREDPSEFITHRAKDFVSSIKDIEHRFFRASEAGKEVSKMLEANKIRVGYAEAKGDSSDLPALSVFKLVCCRGAHNHLSHDPPQNVTRIITWKRSMSLQSSSSRNPLAGASKDDGDDSGSDFVEDFCMISGSHSSTLDRLYAWERKLYDEVKASESVRKVYDRTCDQLKHQFAKDHSTHVVDKTLAVAKDLHSRLRVSLYSVDSIAKRIEKMRDDELQPQLVELVQGFIRMWKAMLECHHSQYITISLAYLCSEVQSHYNFGPLCENLSINYLDRFLSAYQLPKGKAWMMQLLAVACLYLAAKIEETKVPLAVDLQTAESRFVFEPKTIQRMELLVLCTLKWRMQSVTPFSFIEYFLSKLCADQQIHPRCLFPRASQLIISATKGIEFLEFRPSEVAAAVAISVVREAYTRDDIEKAISLLSVHVEPREGTPEIETFVLSKRKGRMKGG